MNPVLQQVCDAYGAALAPRPAAWCQLHPQGDQSAWSAQDLIEHLVLTMRNTRQLLEMRLERGRATRRRPALVEHLRRLAVLSLRRMPRGVTAPPFTCPGQTHWPGLSGAELAERLRQELAQMDQVIETCALRFGAQRIATHFQLGPLSAEEWRRFHGIHGRHHLRQLHRIEQRIRGSGAPATTSSPGQARQAG